MNFQAAKKEFGSVVYNGVEVAMTQNAYVENAGSGVAYFSQGIDQKGNVYMITWDTTQAWDDAQELYNKTQGEVALSLLQDESNACEWDRPTSIKLVESVDD